VATVFRLASIAAGALVLAACGGSGGSSGGDGVSGRIAADGSSTVGPLVTFAAEQFQRENSGVQITVGVSGTGGGFERFCRGETDLSDASRAIKDEEAEICERNGVEYAELLVANDGIAIVVNLDNDWIDCVTTEQLKQIWEPESKVETWEAIDASFPNEKLTLAGPGTDSGTFDFFTEKINGEDGASRSDYNASENDNVIVQAVSGDKGGLGYFGLSYVEENRDQLKDLRVDAGGLGYFGFSYYEGNTDKLNLVGVDDGGGCVKPAKETIQDGSYKPLSRPLFMYPKSASIAKPAVKAFMTFVVENQDKIAEAAKIVPLTPEQVTAGKSELQKAEAAS